MRCVVSKKLFLCFILFCSNYAFGERTFQCIEKEIPNSWKALSAEGRKKKLSDFSDQELFSFFMYEVTNAKGDKPLFLADGILKLLESRNLHEDKINLVKLMAIQGRIMSLNPEKLDKKEICKVIQKINNKKLKNR